MSIHRLLIQVNSRWSVTISRPDAPGWSRQRALRRQEVPGRKWLFPLSPADDLPAADKAHRVLCEGADPLALRTAYEGIIDRKPKQVGAGPGIENVGGVQQFGAYLFHTLIGPALWDEIRRQPDHAPEDVIELALSWARTETHLHRLNWEMMAGPDGFLGKAAPVRVAITRLVQGAAQSARAAHLPPRILFVIGTALTERKIRPGAEYFGLLRELEKAGYKRCIETRVLQFASPSRIIEAVKEFRPDIVHFICHGYTSEEGKGTLELQLDENETDEQLKRRDAVQLAGYLRAAGDYPPLVVLSACYSGVVNGSEVLTLGGAHHAAPLAAELVAEGVPAVIGMAGRVSDVACRLFTKLFGDALVSGDPIVTATTRGRWAALNFGSPPADSVDWAFPALYMAEGVASDYTPTPRAASQEEIDLRGILERLDVLRKPVFAVRYEVLDAFRELFTSSVRKVLALFGDRGHGKTRLLQEMAAEAVHDGHVPFMISSDDPAWEAPRTLEDVRRYLVDAITNTREAFRLSTAPSQLPLLAPPLNPAAPPVGLRDEIKQELVRPQPQPTARALQLALQHDIGSLVAEAREKHPRVAAAQGRPVLLFDEVQEYDRTFLDDLFSRKGVIKVLGNFGLGTDQEPIPVVLAFIYGGAAHEIFKGVLETPLARPWLRAIPLQRFTEEEGLLPYGNVLLHPYDAGLCEGVSDVAWVVNPDVPLETARLWEARFRQKLKQIPDDFVNPRFYDLVEWAAENQLFLKADDEKLLRNLS